MKLPSISQALASTLRTYLRFPLIILVAEIGTARLVAVIDLEDSVEPSVLYPIIFAAVFAFPLLTGLAILAERRNWSKATSIIAQAGGVVLATIYSLTVPHDLPHAPEFHTLRLVALASGWALFAFSVPFAGHLNEQGYWNYAKTLVLRILVAALYTVILFAGLALALAALDNLFGVNVPPKRYGELWILMNGLFATWFFLAGVPEDFEALDHPQEYPKGLKVFAQYILSPLVLVYFSILYLYIGKILLVWDWPRGWVSGLILGFVATGFSTLLLLHPIKDRPENSWVRSAGRWFYVLAVPLIVMLFLAVWRRVTEYGVTEGRYLGLAVVVWLCVIVPYYLLSRKRMIRFIPLSLCVMAFLVSLGPWSMFTVSERSQVDRLETLLTANQILADGRIHKTRDSVSNDATKQISSILAYLSEIHGFDAIQPWFSENLKADSTGEGIAFKPPARIAELMGIEFTNVRSIGEGTSSFGADRESPLLIAGYDLLLPNQRIYTGFASRDFQDHGISFQVRDSLNTVRFILADSGSVAETLRVDVRPLYQRLLKEYGSGAVDRVPVERMTLEVEGRTAKIRVFIPNLTIQKRGDETKVLYYDMTSAVVRR